jgi:hypothetical protein
MQGGWAMATRLGGVYSIATVMDDFIAELLTDFLRVRCELLTEGSKNTRHLPRYLFIQRNPEFLSAYHH